jgi:putative membrane protein
MTASYPVTYPIIFPWRELMKKLSVLAAGLIAPAFAFAEIREVDDEQIVQVVITAHRMAIETGLLAKSKSSNPDVRTYARRKISDHEALNKQAAEMVDKFELAPRDSAINEELRTDIEKGFTQLAAMNGAAFDKAYIDQNVVLHQHVLDTIDNRLMPQATREELKALLYHMFAPLSEHLEHALQIQGSLK